MDPHSIPWAPILWGIIKFLKVFGVIPGAIAAYSIQKFYQKWRQKQAMEGWPTADATVLSGEVHKEGPWRFWAQLTYSYYVGEYRSGKYLRRFRREEDADEFVRQARDKRIQMHFKDSDPERSVILDRDIEMLVLVAPQHR